SLPLQLNTIPFLAYQPHVAIENSDSFGVIWDSYIYRRFDAAGTPIGAETPLSTGGAAFAFEPNERFMLIGSVQDSPYSRDIAGREYSPDGVPECDQVRINTYTTDDQTAPAVAIDADGDVVIAWSSRLQDGSDLGVYAQRFLGPDPTVRQF